MTSPAPRPVEMDALAYAVQSTGSVRIRLDDLWTMWTHAAPRLSGHPDQAAALAAALHELATRGTVLLPTTAWDSSTTPPLPRLVTVPAARKPIRQRAWTTFPWRHELGWAASLSSITDDQMRDLTRINEWLARTNGGQGPLVPVRYRSVEILGDEKRIDALERTRLFGPGRLSLQLLACIRIPAPLPASRLGAGPDVLVVENSDTYWAAVHTLASTATHIIGAVAWGSGGTFPSQVAALTVDVAGAGPVTGRVWYWGDLDPKGLDIAAAAAKIAQNLGAPPIRPAAGLWSAMAGRPVQVPGTITWTDTPAKTWLGPTLWDTLAPVREARGRVAQEAVPAEAIAAWAQSLSSAPSHP